MKSNAQSIAREPVPQFQPLKRTKEETPDLPPADQKYTNPEVYQIRKFLKDVVLPEKCTLAQFAQLISQPMHSVQQILNQFGEELGANDFVSYQSAKIIGYEQNFKVIPEKEFKTQQKVARPPIVTIMGHVDHGKTTLLDSFRKSNIVATEFGGITQKIGAFHKICQDGQRITFIDTPGHEAFTNMRLRGSQCTDMIILVVSAADGIQQQTKEVINIAQSQNIPLIIAINKIDVPGTNPLTIEEQLYHSCNLNIEPFGGNIPVIHISAKTGQNVDLLEEMILFQAELLEIQEVKSCAAEGIVLESRRNQKNETKNCTIVIQKGTLKQGDLIIIDQSICKVKQIKDDKGQLLKEAYPSYAVEIIGMKELPKAGDAFFSVESDLEAKLICQRKEISSELNANPGQEIVAKQSKIKFKNRKEKMQFHSGNKQLWKEKFDEVEQNIIEKINSLKSATDKESLEKLSEYQKDLENHKVYMERIINPVDIYKDATNLILKANDFGTLETLRSIVNKMISQYSGAKVNLISSSVGHIIETDIKEASMYNATILCMEVSISNEMTKLAKQERVTIKNHRIIYALTDEILALMNKANTQGTASTQKAKGSGEILSVFKIKSSGKGKTQMVAGCNVSSGTFNKDYTYKILRNGATVAENVQIANLKHFKDEVNEIQSGSECGITFFNFQEFQSGDQLEAYDKPQQIKPGAGFNRKK